MELAGVNELSDRETKVVAYPGKPPYRSIILVRLGDAFRAYWNVCKHVSIPLDGGLGHLPLAKDELVCLTHGARYRSDDGLCIKGPCKDQKLDVIELEVIDDKVVALLEQAEA